MTYRQALENLDEYRESPFSSTLFPDFEYYAIRVAPAKPRGLFWYVDSVGKLIERIIVISRNGKHCTYIKLYGDNHAYSPANIFETYEDAIDECISRNGDRNRSRLLDVEGKEIHYQEVLAAVAR